MITYFTIYVSMVQDFRKRWDRQSRAFYNLFRQADRVERLSEIIQRLVVISFPSNLWFDGYDSHCHIKLLSHSWFDSTGARWFEAQSSSFGVREGFPACCSCTKDNRKCEFSSLVMLSISSSPLISRNHLEDISPGIFVYYHLLINCRAHNLVYDIIEAIIQGWNIHVTVFSVVPPLCLSVFHMYCSLSLYECVCGKVSA